MKDNFAKDEADFLKTIENDHFWYKSRRILAKHFLEYCTKENEQGKILDVGCGNGSMVETIKDAGLYIGLDYEHYFAKNSKSKGALTVAGDARKIPFKDECFDIVTAFDILEHIDDDTQVVGECHRVLKKGGHLIIFVPAVSSLWTAFDMYSHHKRRYDKKAILNILYNKKFFTKRCSYYFSFLLPVLLCIAASEKLGFHRVKWEISWKKRLRVPNKLVNAICTALGKMEAFLATKLDIPIGTSLVIIAEKYQNDW